MTRPELKILPLIQTEKLIRYPTGEKPEWSVNPQAEYVKDIWDARALGVEPRIGKSSYKLNFSSLSQPWLRQTAKQYIKLCLSSISFSSTQEKLHNLRALSRFLAKDYPEIQPVAINRTIITEFTIYLAGLKLAPQSRHKILCEARQFFDTCYQNEWLNIPKYLVRQEDFPNKHTKHLPRYIPEDVMTQLNQYLDELALPLMRMVLVLQECGMRISELVHLDFDCLLQDTAGDYFLRYYQFKMKKEITIPISPRIVSVIQEQQRYLRKYIAEATFPYLFSANGGTEQAFTPVPKAMKQDTLPRLLNRLVKTHNICDSTGKQWHFQTHQFRHTVGTRMANNGVPQHIIQRYLGHESPSMTATYATIHDKTMKAEIAKYQSKTVSIAGQAVNPKGVEADDETLQWFRHNTNAHELSSIYFQRPLKQLPEYKDVLRQIEKLIEKAKANDWMQQVKLNEAVKSNLEGMIAGLEGKENDNPA